MNPPSRWKAIIAQFVVGGLLGGSIGLLFLVIAMIFVGREIGPRTWLGTIFGLTIFLGFVASIVLTAIRFALRENRDQKQDANSRQGLCRNCGYDLRGTTDRCPECGEFLRSKDRARIKRANP